MLSLTILIHRDRKQPNLRPQCRRYRPTRSAMSVAAASVAPRRSMTTQHREDDCKIAPSANAILY